MSSRAPSSQRRLARGLSLVEILVGVAIGMIGVVAIFQAVSSWTKHTQTTSSGGDAQVAGTLALFNIERDLKQAGHGFGRAITPVMGCNVWASDTTPARTFNFGMRPVDIAVSGAAGAPDQINVFYGNSSFYVEQGDFTVSTATSKKLLRRGGFKQGDLVVAAFNPGAAAASAECQLLEITSNTNPDGYTIAHDGTPYSSDYAVSGAAAIVPRFNSASTPAFSAGMLYDLGPRPTRYTWSIPDPPNNRALTKADLIHPEAGVQQVAEGVINLKAEYGYDADNNGQISDVEWMAALPVNADWKRVYAIRVAVLVRSRQFERGDPAVSAVAVTPTAARPTYFGSTPPAKNFQMLNVDGSADSYTDADALPNNWRFYRYRVYERVIPLRNMLWGNFG
jgi:type IV pilus assembly protein PilW